MSRLTIRLALYAVAALLILAGLNHAAQYVPFTPQWSAKRAAAKVESLEGQVSSLERTAEGNAAIGQAVETYHTETVIVRDLTSQAINEARSAPDAETPLSDERANRLRAADRVLCEQSSLCAAAAADAP